DRIVELRVQNKRLQQQITNLENKILSLVGMVDIESSGGAEKKNVLNDLLINIINDTQDQLNIVTPRIDGFYANELKKVVERGIPILLITNDRSDISKDYIPIYDDLKLTQGISIINNPNVKYLLVFNTEQAIYSGGSLDKEELSKSILIVTKIQEKTKLRMIAEIFSLMLPTFMRR
ncbi:MAG: hypothetical protein ACFFCL_04485, partial [Promethearchaeota archaeon]